MRTCSTVERASVEVTARIGDRAEVKFLGADDKCPFQSVGPQPTTHIVRARTMAAAVTNAINLTRPRVAPRRAARRVVAAKASPDAASAPVSNLGPSRSSAREVAQVAAKKAVVAVPAKGSEPATADRPFDFAGSLILAVLIGGGLTVFRILKTKMDEREQALYEARVEAAAEAAAEEGGEAARDRNDKLFGDYAKTKEEMDAAAKAAEDKAEGK